jgi:RsiW-degrading membrane proteinase PrsW (M82 family)
MFCGRCGYQLGELAAYCGHCGAPISTQGVSNGLPESRSPGTASPKVRYCGKCGNPLSKAAAYCGRCGAPVLGHGQGEAAFIVPPQNAGSKATTTRNPRVMSCFNRAVLILILAFGACALFSLNMQMIGDQQFDGRTMLLVTVASVVPAILYGALIISVDVREREPGRILLFAFLWGALVAAVGSYFVSGDIYWIVAGVSSSATITEFLMAVVAAPYVEELAKAAGLLAIIAFFRREFNNVTDGIVYGALIGLGFSVTENILYLGWAHSQEGIEGFALLFYTRVALGGLGHATYTALTGAGFGYARERNSTRARLGFPLLGLAFAMAGHSAWNGVFAGLLVTVFSPDDPFIFLVTVPMIAFVALLPGLVALAVLLVRSWRREADIITAELEPELREGLLTSEEHARLVSVRARLAFEMQMLRTHGFATWRSSRRFHQKLTGLAFRKWQAKNDGSTSVEEQELDDRYRDVIRALRAEMPSTAQPGKRDAAVPG